MAATADQLAKERANKKRRREEDPERVRAEKRRWREGNQRAKELQRDYNRKWREANPGRAKEVADAATQRWREANPDKVREQRRRFREAHPDGNRQFYVENADYWKAWREANPEKVKDISTRGSQRRRARKLEAFVEDVDRMVVYERDNGICQICQVAVAPDDFHLDHIMPLSRGGEHSYANCQTTHALCNMRKGNSLP